MAPKSSWKDFLIDTSHVLKQSVMAEILGRSTGNHYGTVKTLNLTVEYAFQLEAYI